MGKVVHFKRRTPRAVVVASDQGSGVQAGTQTLAKALNTFAKPRLWTAVERLQTALEAAKDIGARLPAGSAKIQFELERDMLVKNLTRLQQQISDL